MSIRGKSSSRETYNPSCDTTTSERACVIDYLSAWNVGECVAFAKRILCSWHKAIFVPFASCKEWTALSSTRIEQRCKSLGQATHQAPSPDAGRYAQECKFFAKSQMAQSTTLLPYADFIERGSSHWNFEAPCNKQSEKLNLFH